MNVREILNFLVLLTGIVLLIFVLVVAGTWADHALGDCYEIPPDVYELWDELGIEEVALGRYDYEKGQGCGVFVKMRDGENVCVGEFEEEWPR